MHSDERRKAIADVLRAADAPVSASALAEKFSVSRQIIVGDIALLRSSGEEILATPRGYVTPREARGIVRRVAVKHTPQEMEAELNTIVDNGCTVIDVIVDHPIYGQLTGPLQISNRYEVSQFIAGKWRAYARDESSAQKTLTIRIVACETGSEISPPGGETAPMAVTEPRLSSEPRHLTTPARS